FRARGGSVIGRPEVMLWPDTFTNHFDPAIARAAVDVLEHAGFSVVVPERLVCCGLTWISTGQLKTAKRVLRRTLRPVRDPLDAELLDSGCCGLAGNFGFERGHHDVSVACAERVLMPRVRQESADTLVMADGFSCRTQIAELSDRRALHSAEVLQMALHKAEP